MNSQNQPIEINGTLYDRVTGKKLSTPVPKKSTPAHHTSQKVPAHVVHSRHQKAQTLMRSVVKKPGAASNHAVKPEHTHASTPVSAKSHTPSSGRVAAVSPQRKERAESVKQIDSVARFSAPKPAQKPQLKSHIKQTPTFQMPQQQKAAASQHIMPSMVASATNPELSRLISDAIGSSTSHTLKPLKKPLHKRVPAWAPIVVLAVIATSIIGMMTVQKSDMVALHFANKRSGINATLPGYNAPNFAFKGPILYDKNHVTINYHSSVSPEMNYALTQRATTWDDSSLVADFLVAEAHNYQAIQDKGRTVYIYDDSNATWVDKGKWYTIENKGNLNSDQLLQIANSL